MNEEIPDLVAVEVRDFRGCHFARIDFDKVVTVLGGKNSAGKTSVVDGIRAVFDVTQKTMPADPVRDGADEARVWADLGTMTVERIIPADAESKPTLRVKRLDGKPVTAAQRTLAEMYDAAAFDPSEFVTMPKDKQDWAFRETFGINLDDLDAEHKAKFDERSAVNREVKQLEGQLAAADHYPGAPAEETTTAELVAELEQHDRWAAEMNLRSSAHARAKEAHDKAQADVERLMRELEQARNVFADAMVALSAAHRQLNEDAPKRPGATRDDITTRIANADETNRKVRSNKQRAELTRRINTKKAESDALTKQLERIKEQKVERISKVEFPIPGLGFDELGPSYNGHPLKQCGEAELWVLACAICMTRNPKLKFVLIRRGSQIDDESLAAVYQMAKAKGFKVLLEIVTRTPEDEKRADVMMRNGVSEVRS